MQAADVLQEVLTRSGMSKAALSAASGVSRSSLDDYLKGRREPSLAQVTRLVAAAGLSWHARFDDVRRSLPEEFVAVLDFGDVFPRKERPPLKNLGPLWRAARQQHVS